MNFIPFGTWFLAERGGLRWCGPAGGADSKCKSSVPCGSHRVALLWSGLSLSAIGDQLYAVALSWIAVGVLGQAAGYLSALQQLVLLVAVLGLGGWADRRDHRRSMIGADLVRAASLAVVIAAWMLQGAPSAVALVMAIVVLGVGQALFNPAMQALLPGLVPNSALLPATNGLLDATERSARLLGPGLVGLLAGIIPVEHFLTIDALSFVVSAMMLLRIGRHVPALAHSVAVRREPVWHSIRRGVRAMRSHPIMGFVLATSAPVNGSWYLAMYLALPLLVEQRHLTGPGGSGLGAYGLVISAYGCTNLASTLVFGGRPMPRRPQFQMFGGSVLVGVGTLSMALAGLLPDGWVLPGLMAAAALGAAGGPMGDIPQAVLRQTRMPHADRAAAMRAKMAVNSCGALGAMLLAPTLIAAGLLPVMGGCGVVMIGLGALGLWWLRGWVEVG